MAEFYKGTIPILDVDHPTDAMTDMLHPNGVSFGYVERDYELFPEAMFAQPNEMDVIEPVDHDAYFDEQEERQSSLEHIYLNGPNGEPAFVNLDQNGHGYCWNYSVYQSAMIDMLSRGLIPPRFNPHAGAAIIKGGRDQGGWCGEGGEFATLNGLAVEGTGLGQWPKHSRNLKYDTPELRKEMAKYKLDEQWVDLTKQVWDRNMTINQIATNGFCNIAGPGDYPWWGHSVCRLRWVRIERNAWGQLILNSWLNWGRFGLAVLRGNQAVPQGALGIRSVTL